MSDQEQAAKVCGRCGVALVMSFSRKFGLCMDCSVCRESCCHVTTAAPDQAASDGGKS